MHSPLEQFNIKVLLPIKVAGLDVSFSNSSLMMLIVLFITALFLFLGTSSSKAVPNRLEAAVEVLYDMIENMVKSTAGSEARKYFPFIFSLFIFILFCNLFSMLPYAFTVTSHIAVTMAFAAFIFVCVTVIGFYKHGMHYFSLLVPSGTPILMAPMLFVIELIAYLARPVSLSIRLAANMIAGHVVLKVLASMAIMAGFFGIFPLMLLTLLTGFEIFVAVLQAYIFSILTCVYLSDALNLH
ncbi:F0F1 ATP synthase subunit A [Candidatus Lariskella endosymbiont of Hedychridium roseum]|uniref:F0F1 ATP synthase subunit A n=1 Tax=Candidatus Lariskella endosymbiont of Hedychridium roseum TaxID=3077949 RepID=UPI0030D421A4